jgi:hypothetical protein
MASRRRTIEAIYSQVKPMDLPKGVLYYMDYKFSEKKLEEDKKEFDKKKFEELYDAEFDGQ